MLDKDVKRRIEKIELKLPIVSDSNGYASFFFIPNHDNARNFFFTLFGFLIVCIFNC